MSADVARPASQLSATRNSRPSSSRNLHPFSVTMPLLPQQYALPVNHVGSRRCSNHPSSDGSERMVHAENTLRRKTPTGTLNAGYDGTVDGLHPQKHQLLPLISDGPISRHSHVPAEHVKRTFLQHQQHRNSGAHVWDGSAVGWSGSPYGPLPPTSFPVMDSMLHQMPAQFLNPQQHYGQTVPSVLQPSFQQLGPTASGGQGSGLYGPYWHDGTFVPYRPAAVRDPRFYHHPPAPSWSPSLPGTQVAHGANLWQYNAHGQWPQFQDQNPAPFGSHSPAHPSTLDQRPPADLTHLGGISPGANQNVAAGYSQLNTPTLTLDSLNVDSEFGPTSANGQQRDKTFAWALQQYRELLAFIHHTRRQHHSARPAQSQHPAHRPTFYPKPPQPSPSGSSSLLKKRRTQSNAANCADDGVSPASPSKPVAEPATGLVGIGTNPADIQSTHAPSLWSPNGVVSLDNEYQRRAARERQTRLEPTWPQPLQNHVDKFHVLRRSSGSSIAPIVSPPSMADSPSSRAAVALSYITKLCQETDWQWIDGMHLGGCLAYGLGNYPKALRWYAKVLETDPKHLEATSNLAATLLALGRRQEAEQHWMKVIKAAPNHFEAVEHLIGLLCTEQRCRDAIRVIEHVERSLRQPRSVDLLKVSDRQSECSSSTASRSPCLSDLSDRISYDFEADGEMCIPDWRDHPSASEPGFGSSGFAIPGCDNGRILALIHAKGNMLYGLGDNAGAAHAFEDAVMIAAGRKFHGMQGLVQHILTAVSSKIHPRLPHQLAPATITKEPILLTPDQALATSKLCFPYFGELPGLQHVPGGPQSLARRAVISTTSNSLLSLAKIFQDGMSNANRSAGITPLACGVRDILALYYLSLSLQPSPSTANNVGILLASVQQAAPPKQPAPKFDIPGVVPGSGIALALQYYNYGLQLDQHHAHLYTNLGSLLKDIGQLDAAINMYERAVKCDGKFDIALVNLANAVKDKGRISDAILYYKRAVEVSPDFAEAVCGLANALNSVCGWQARGGIADDGGRRDRWHVDANGMLVDGRRPGTASSGWVKQVVDIVEKQLIDGEIWGRNILTRTVLEDILKPVLILESTADDAKEREDTLRKTVMEWTSQKWEGARVTRLVERATRRIGWHWYHDTYVKKRPRSPYNRPQLPAALTVPTAPTVLPFHAFTCPMSAKQVRLISQRNGLRISVSTLRAPWLPKQVYPPPKPPAPVLKVGYVSSDFNNHPLAHLMQSVFGLHDSTRVEAYCYATTASDNSVHRQQIQAEAPVFHDASSWSVEKLVGQIVKDGIHILVNLNGYTRGARNEVFAARPAPIQMSFMGFAGTLGAEWCDYLLADETAIPPQTLRPWRRNVDLGDQLVDENNGGANDEWVYGENVIYCRDTFFCCDHRQSAPDAHEPRLGWEEEQSRRWQMRRELFPHISDETIIFGNFNQLYKIDPTTFRTWLRILARVPNAILWLLRFPDLGESHLLATARLWAGADVVSRIHFTDVAPKQLHIARARVCDAVLDTAECNAHTTAADVLWSGTPLLTLPRYPYKMCSRMAASILRGALPPGDAGARAGRELIATGEEDYEEKAVALGTSLVYAPGCEGRGRGRLMEMRRLLYEGRWSSALFDTRRWVRDLEDAYDAAWERWVTGEGGDIWLDRIPRKGD